jgi:flagellar biosynthesis/type III secretory pathway chaperone
MNVNLQPEIENALEDLLNRETGELVQFIDLLEEELDALAAGRADAVHLCASRKQNLLGRIFATRDAVNAVVRRASSNPQLKSAESWLARTSSARIRHAFDQLTDHADHARQLSQLAGRLIQMKLQSINERLDVLQPAGRMSAVYFPEGFAAAPMSSKGAIGRA